MKRLATALLLCVLASALFGQTLIRLGATPASSAPIRDYVKAAYERLGVKVEMMEVPSERARGLFSSGDLDAIMYERPEIIATFPNGLAVGAGTGPLFSFTSEAYILAETTASLKKLADLKGKNVAYIRGLRMDSYVTALGATPIEAESVDAAVKMLLAKRCDAIVSATNSLVSPIEANKAQGRILAIAEFVSEAKYFHVLSKKYASLQAPLAEEFRKTAAELRKIMGN